ncbi:AdoMet-dependent rRNA methyltransferase spb1 [Tulasnella sp. UAMH 9824]|nr:AdoMet-dependent rRNA methyltransferase spb1 [Tulasnella sp. UAMH 9824]
MGKSVKKSAKGRLDKYYKLAKEQGFRARSAFKLIQLNRKYEFLTRAKFCIDLCAAPGGWLQVASKYMPQGSLILGCDLDAIKPIPRVITFVADITTPACRQMIQTYSKGWLADVILHDGAPNVGQAWVQDAYSQADLVLSSLKLAVEFLKKGGTFITKVFRSKDYNSLMWVFSQLFGKVEATKPPSSRNVSAEIFVVCMNYKAPAHIDPKFLDPKHVFKDLDSLPPAPIVEDAMTVASGSTHETASSVRLNAKLTPSALAVFKAGSKKVRHRDGYADDAVTTLFKAGAASQFVLGNAATAITFLGEVNRIDFISEEEKRWFDLPITDDDIKADCADLKVLGKREFQRLLKWRASIREQIGIESKQGAGEEATEVAEITPLDPAEEDEQIQQELERLNDEAAARRKRERRKKNEKRAKEAVKLQLRMTVPTDIGLEVQDQALHGRGAGDDFFDINEAERKRVRRAGEIGLMAAYDRHDDASSDEDGLPKPEDVTDTTLLDSEEEEEQRVARLEAEIDGMYEAYMQKMMEKDAKFRVREGRKKDKERSEVWEGVSAPKRSGDSDSENEDEDELLENDPKGERGWDGMMAARRKIGESSDEEDGGSDSESSSSRTSVPGDDPSRPHKRRRTSVSSEGSSSPVDHQPPTRLVKTFAGLAPSKPAGSKAAQLWFGQDIFKSVGDLDDLTDDEDKPPKKSESESEASSAAAEELEDDGFEEVPQEPEDTTLWDVDDENIDEKKQELIKKHGLLTAEAVTMAQKLVNRQVTKTHLINDGFNRLSLNHKDGLPQWFLEEESNYYGVSLPVTKEAVRMLRAKQRALNARPMKKIAEARARKKLRAVKRLQKAAKMAEGMMDNGDMSEKQKAEAMMKVMRRAGAKKTKSKGPIKTIVARGNYKGVKGELKGVKGRYRIVDKRMKKDLAAEKRAAKGKKKRKH